jgi:hypothetical protein
VTPADAAKRFDCLEFKRKVQAAIYEEIKDLTPAQQREYFRRGAGSGPLGVWWQAVKQRSETER